MECPVCGSQNIGEVAPALIGKGNYEQRWSTHPHYPHEELFRPITILKVDWSEALIYCGDCKCFREKIKIDGKKLIREVMVELERRVNEADLEKET